MFVSRHCCTSFFTLAQHCERIPTGSRHYWPVVDWAPILQPNAANMEPREERKMRKRLRKFWSYSTPHAIMYRTLIEKRDNRNCGLDDDRWFTSKAFTTRFQLVDDRIGGKFVTLDINFLMFFAQSNVNHAMRTVDSETEERIMKSDGIIMPVHAHEQYWVVAPFRRGPHHGTVMLFDYDFVAWSWEPPLKTVASTLHWPVHSDSRPLFENFWKLSRRKTVGHSNGKRLCR